ncbi:replication initiator protein [Peromfec virus RodF8_53]|uniref:Replication initiator protein n=1 Tax=Peromfec virus RodF8_53 TaxID=2929382 RepID=A0A976N2I8_9VIRU|nr:replication initiator protein [Peromfec virus RodF8_53]
MCLYPVYIKPKLRLNGNYIYSSSCARIQVPCGKCLECLSNQSIEWAFRISDEAKLYSDNCFITLTYNNDFLPEGGSLCRRDVQLFLKLLRRRLAPRRIRVFYCGEYGKKHLRPHYHIIVFNFSPTDLKKLPSSLSGKEELYRSQFIESIWTKGFSSVGKLTFESAKYCAKYMQKFKYFEYDRLGLVRPFVGMSNRPGIGYSAALRCDTLSDKIYYQGRYIKTPRYYLKVLEREGVCLDFLKERRKHNMYIYSSDPDKLIEKRKRYFRNFLSPLL